MGLFSFLKDTGAKLFGKKKAASPTPAAPSAPTVDYAEIERKQRTMLLNGVIDTLGLPNENITISMEGTDVVVLSGTCDTQADKEKIILALGNVDGIAFVDDRVSVTNPQPPAVFYTVTKTDTLGKIAKVQYGDAMKYPVIFEANKPMLTHPDKIYPGQVLRIPPVEGTYSATAQGGAVASTYTVKSGDTLGKIAKAIYGDAMKYKDIYAANMDTMKSPDSVRVGQVLNIPSANNIA